MGNKFVGKTCLINQFIDNIFVYDNRMLLDKSYIKMKFNDSQYLIEINDTYGIRWYRKINELFIKNTKIVIFVYDITNINTFYALEEHYKLFCKINKGYDFIFGVIANKTDLDMEQEVSKEKGEVYAKSINAFFFETSAKDYENVKNIFEILIQKYFEKEMNKNNNQNNLNEINLDIESNESKNERNNSIEDDDFDINQIIRKNELEKEDIINENEDIDNQLKEKDKNSKRGIYKIEEQKISNSEIYKEEGIYYYKNGDIYEGKLDENNKKIGKGIMRYNNGEIYDGEWNNNKKEGEGILCLNNEDYNIIKDIIIDNNNLDKLFNLNLKGSFYKGIFKNDLKDGNGILYMNNKNNFLNNNIIFKGIFKNNHKLNGNLYFKNKSYLNCYWKDENNIEETITGIFTINNSIEFKNKLNTNEWINLIKKEQLNYYGNSNINIPPEIIIR